MINRTALLTSVLLICFAAAATGQEYPDWSGFPPMFHVKDIVRHDGIIYGVTDSGMFSYDPVSGEYELTYKNNGIGFTHLTCIAETSDYLYIGTRENGLWRYDVKTDRFNQITFPEYHLKTSSNPTGMSINSIYVKNDSTLYVGHSKGLDRLNLETEELRAYTHLGTELPKDTAVNGITVHRDTLWVATAQGLALAEESNPNLEFAENWRGHILLSRTGSPIPLSDVAYVEDAYESMVYLAAPTAGILRFDFANDELKQVISNFQARDFVITNGKCWAVGDDGLGRKDGLSWAWFDFSRNDLNCIMADDEGKLWIGSEYDGLMAAEANGTYIDIPLESHMRGDTIYQMSLSPSGVLWAATAYRDANPSVNYAVILRYDGETWSFYDEGPASWTSTGVAVLADTPERTWVGSWGIDGLRIIEDDGSPGTEGDSHFIADPSKNIIRHTINPWFVICSDMTTDEKGNVWVANYQAEEHANSGLVVVDDYPITRSATYSTEEGILRSSLITKICSTRNGWMWVGTWNQGLTGVYTGPDPYDKSDTVKQDFTLNEGLLSMKITALASDSQGNLWVGTEAGLNLLTPSGNRYEIADMNDVLEGYSRDITSITVDDEGNTWIGTSGGLVKLNPQNQFEASYTVENSGLYSDEILSLLYDSGREVLWIGTDLGINRFDPGMNGKVAASASVHIYPNPFELWGFDSQVVFTNLEAGSPVDIYSFDGVLVNRVTAPANATEAIWDGRNFRDDYVGTGVYFIVGADAAGNTFRDKLLVMRR